MTDELTKAHLQRIREERKNLTPTQYQQLLMNLINALEHERQTKEEQ